MLQGSPVYSGQTILVNGRVDSSAALYPINSSHATRIIRLCGKQSNRTTSNCQQYLGLSGNVNRRDNVLLYAMRALNKVISKSRQWPRKPSQTSREKAKSMAVIRRAFIEKSARPSNFKDLFFPTISFTLLDTTQAKHYPNSVLQQRHDA